MYYVQPDHPGTPQKITDATKAVVWDGQFIPFGQELSITGALVANYRCLIFLPLVVACDRFWPAPAIGRRGSNRGGGEVAKQRWIGVLVAAGLVTGLTTVAGPAAAQIGDILLAPKTLIDRAIEARSTQDIAADNRIVVDVNAIMVEYTTLKASTEIYEQRLLMTGLFDDEKLFNEFSAKVRAVEGVKELHWHVAYLSADEQQRRAAELLAWSDVLVLSTKIGVNLIGTRGVADVNFRTAVDSFATAYLLGRARSQEELDKALAAVRGTEGVAQVVNYAVVRP